MRNNSVILLILLLFGGCVGIGAPVLSPYYNAQNADALLSHGRPLPAERLIEITIKKSQEKGDEVGLAMGYGAFAGFLQSPVLIEWKKHYVDNGFFDSTVIFENRYEKSREYWLKAINLYEKNQEYAAVSNAYINLATLENFEFDNKNTACSYLDSSLEYHEQFKVTNPGETVNLPKGYSSFNEYIAAAKKQIGCN